MKHENSEKVGLILKKAFEDIVKIKGVNIGKDEDENIVFFDDSYQIEMLSFIKILFNAMRKNPNKSKKIFGIDKEVLNHVRYGD